VTVALPTSAQILEALVKLGETSDDVAEALQQRGIRGVKGMARCCPLANYLKKEFPAVTGLGVTPYYVRVDVGNSGESVYSHISESASEFVDRFDKGSFQGLTITYEELGRIA